MTDTTPESDEETEPHPTDTTGSTKIAGEAKELRFRSDDEECAASLYRPDGPTEVDIPCVVMGNGFSLTRRDGLPYFAERFAAAGIATLTFDFRHLGDSDGEPRQLIDYQRQRADLTAAIDFARSLEGIDADRIATWGFSFGGGHAVHVAANDDRVAAAVSMFPIIDGLAAAREYGLRTNARLIAAAARAAMGRRPLRMRVTGPPGSPAVLNQPEAEPGFAAVCAEDSTWRNEFLAKPSQPLAEIRPVHDVPNVGCPLLFCLGTKDTIAPVGPIERAADRAPRGELRRYPVGHFDGFLDAFEEVVGDQIEFLNRHLTVSPSA
ncbi:alpha/beta hydrolase [Natrarchaeobius chitinivorans]|uniref:Alpha/beta hydrolase n=1 Tax=Natrarchaeobius chitinivorans TaxID=1679083 RepID=A0A3N6LVU2_NATCH|nr:alpha/beta hydrolase [Natrarchaeobius chitinivorans]RQG94638.1 alpha/beta hydrolase [Natrarchaeobius chitinivorans]